MPIREIFRLALEALLANKLRSGLTMLGLIIGVGAVVLLVSIGNGAKNYVTGQFEGLGTNLILIQPGRTDRKSAMGTPIGNVKKKMTLGDVEALQRKAFNLDAVTGILLGNGSVDYQGNKNNVQVLGTNEQFVNIFNIHVATGSFYTREDEDSGRRIVTLGHNVAKNLFGDDSAVGKLVKINSSEFRVVGVFEKVGDKVGLNMDEFAFIPTKSALRLFNEDKLFGIRAKARTKVGIQDALDEISTILKERRNGEEDFTLVTQESMLKTMNTILGMLTYVLGGIAMISMIVGGIGIMNIMLVSVTERTREIGIRRAVGARRSDIMRQFLAEAVALAIIGGLIGLTTSVGFTYLVSAFAKGFDMRAPGWILAPSFILSSITGIVFGVWPARKAARIETIEALRFE
ncbi:MAG: ABC transporter permease [Bdellovibrionales bacterium]|nr:ABC transporter permease [Bdellovibrionales bacterium]